MVTTVCSKIFHQNISWILSKYCTVYCVGYQGLLLLEKYYHSKGSNSEQSKAIQTNISRMVYRFIVSLAGMKALAVNIAILVEVYHTFSRVIWIYLAFFACASCVICHASVTMSPPVNRVWFSHLCSAMAAYLSLPSHRLVVLMKMTGTMTFLGW